MPWRTARGRRLWREVPGPPYLFQDEFFSKGPQGLGAVMNQALAQRATHVTTPDLSIAGVDWTVTAWGKLSGVNPGPEYPLVGKYPGEFVLNYISGAGVRLYFSTTTLVETTQRGWTAGTWYFAQGWYDAANQKLSLAVNLNPPNVATGVPGIVPDPVGFAIGGYGEQPPLPAHQYYWDGTLDCVGLWKRLLSDDERSQLYNAGAGLSSFDLTDDLLVDCVSYWDLDGDLTDALGLHDLTSQNGVTFGPGKQ